MIALVLIFVLLAINLLLHSLALKFGARWAKVPNVTFRRAVWVSVLLGFATLVAGTVIGAVLFRVELTTLGLMFVSLAVTVVVECLLVGILLHTSVWRGIRAWLPKVGAFTAMTSVMFLVVKPFVAEGFIQPSHAMAPTLLGPHIRGNCPHCGGPATALYNRETLPHGDPLGMCSACQQPVEKMVGGEILTVSADRFAVCKFLPPARWDVVAVRTPEQPSVLLVSRVVGMPGEEVVIRDGGIWINGVRQEPPDDIRKLQYSSSEWFPDGWGSPNRPAQLGPDEYFVLSDFAPRSSDSRHWGPVPRKNIEGVVSFIYFPVDRWRLLK